ncbi:MAG TPA: PDZ domain-containing protein, partial [Pyrinomonadaceae bacterium]|nr:PDZ domain-containing protein [Pyrinomonadaceae bacterium]
IQSLPNIQSLPRTMQTVPIPPMREGDPNVFVWRGGASRQIGVGVTALTKQLSDYFGVTEGNGLLINNVRENSPAARAGLKAGDIIVEIEGKDVKGQMDLIRAINEKKEGDINLTIIRDRNRQNVRVTPEAAKDGAMKFEEFENFFEAAPHQSNLRMQ